MKTLTIVVDNKIPYIAGLFEPFATVYYLDPSEITPSAVKNADALVIRTRTRCDAALLQKSHIRFIGTATIGFDHIDTEYCRKQGIYWTNAPGCNASSVAQYIAASLCQLSLKNRVPLTGQTIGIVGVGHVGTKVEQVCRLLGLNILRNDPPRSRQETGFVSLDEIARECDFITFHTPLNRGGMFNTEHLADSAFFAQLKRKPVIINSSRGEVVDNRALLHALDNGQISETIIDCWENEPQINSELLYKSYIATPHIAGYSADGKSNGTRIIAKKLASYFNREIDTSGICPPQPKQAELILSGSGPEAIYNTLLSTYQPLEDTARLKENPGQFEWQRGHYPLRREFPAYSIRNASVSDIERLRGFGFKEIRQSPDR